MTGPNKKDGAKDSGTPKLHDPTKEGPFKVDPESGDLATPRNDLSEDELKEQEDAGADGGRSDFRSSPRAGDAVKAY